jgi:hypothetical protein
MFTPTRIGIAFLLLACAFAGLVAVLTVLVRPPTGERGYVEGDFPLSVTNDFPESMTVAIRHTDGKDYKSIIEPGENPPRLFGTVDRCALTYENDPTPFLLVARNSNGKITDCRLMTVGQVSRTNFHIQIGPAYTECDESAATFEHLSRAGG